VTGWRELVVRASGTGALGAALWRWAETGNGECGITAGFLAGALALRFVPDGWPRKKGGNHGQRR
jgi:hypothetical protein